MCFKLLEDKKSLEDMICEQVVNDYFTPNIKAEVILDTLLTPYVSQILRNERGIDAVFLTKEMSIPEGDTFGSAAPKIDYVLAGREAIYLVELKTTDSSIDDAQAESYLNHCQDKLFGEKLGRQLLFILDKPGSTFTLHLDNPDKWGQTADWDDDTLKKAFKTIMHKRFKPFSFSENMVCQKGKCAANARSLILKNKWTQRKEYRSRKYLYTLAQLVDYLNENEGKNSLWNKPIEVIYLTPDGGDITGGGKTCPGISLRTAVRNLCPIPGEEPYINLLQSIIAKIY